MEIFNSWVAKKLTHRRKSLQNIFRVLYQLFELDDKLLTPHFLKEIHPILSLDCSHPTLSDHTPFPHSLGMQESGKGHESGSVRGQLDRGLGGTGALG